MVYVLPEVSGIAVPMLNVAAPVLEMLAEALPKRVPPVPDPE